MRFILAAFLIPMAWCQAPKISLTSSATQLEQGAKATFSYALSGILPPGITALTMDRFFPAGMTESVPVSSVAGKTIRCKVPHCTFWGLNSASFTNGVIATSTVTVDPAAAPGQYSIKMVALATTANAPITPLTLTLSPPMVITVVKKPSKPWWCAILRC